MNKIYTKILIIFVTFYLFNSFLINNVYGWVDYSCNQIPKCQTCTCQNVNCEKVSEGSYTGKECETACTCTVWKPTSTPTPTPIPSISISPTITAGCGCVSNTCSTQCTFNKFSDITYTSPIKCNFNGNHYSTVPSAANKDKWCQSSLKTKGDSDGNGTLHLLDYFYYVSVNSGGKIPPIVNVDYDGNELVDNKDRAILIKSLK